MSPPEAILLRHLVVLTFLARSLDVQVWFWVSEQVGNGATHRKTGFRCEVGDLVGNHISEKKYGVFALL